MLDMAIEKVCFLLKKDTAVAMSVNAQIKGSKL